MLVQVVVPHRVALDEGVGRRLVALILQFQHLVEQRGDHLMEFAIVDADGTGRPVESDQPVLHEVVELHELHHLVSIFALRLCFVEHAQNAGAVDGAQLRVRVVAALVQAVGEEHRDQVGLHLLDQVVVLEQRGVDRAAVLRPVDPEIVSDLVPHGLVGTPAHRVVGAEGRRDDRLPGGADVSVDRLAQHDAAAQQDRAAVAAGDVGLVRLDARRVDAARLAKIRNDVVEPDRDVGPHGLVRRIGKRVLHPLQTAQRLAQRIGLGVTHAQQAEAEGRLGAEQLVIVGLVGADLRVEFLKRLVTHVASPNS